MISLSSFLVPFDPTNREVVARLPGGMPVPQLGLLDLVSSSSDWLSGDEEESLQ